MHHTIHLLNVSQHKETAEDKSSQRAGMTILSGQVSASDSVLIYLKGKKGKKEKKKKVQIRHLPAGVRHADMVITDQREVFFLNTASHLRQDLKTALIRAHR